MTYNLHASNGQQESAGQGGDYVSAEEQRALIDRAERSHAAGAGQMSDEGFLQRRIDAQAARIEWLEWRLRETAGEAVAAYTRIEALEAALRPFARAAEVFDGFKGSYREPASRAICSFVPENFKGDIFDKKHPDLAPITYGDCRNARAALAPEPGK